MAIVAVAILGILVFACSYWFRSRDTGWAPMSSPPIPKHKPVSMSFLLRDQTLSTTANSTGVTEVLKVLRSGKAAPDHDCASVGTGLEIRFANGQLIKIGLHPGHDTNGYEFAVAYHLFTVPRARLLESLKSSGLKVDKLVMDLDAQP